jgi:hypothetical protein
LSRKPLSASTFNLAFPQSSLVIKIHKFTLAWFKTLGIRVTLLEKSNPLKSFITLHKGVTFGKFFVIDPKKVGIAHLTKD